MVSVEGSLLLQANPRAEGVGHKTIDRVRLFTTAPDDKAGWGRMGMEMICGSPNDIVLDSARPKS